MSSQKRGLSSDATKEIGFLLVNELVLLSHGVITVELSKSPPVTTLTVFPEDLAHRSHCLLLQQEGTRGCVSREAVEIESGQEASLDWGGDPWGKATW